MTDSTAPVSAGAGGPGLREKADPAAVLDPRNGMVSAPLLLPPAAGQRLLWSLGALPLDRADTGDCVLSPSTPGGVPFRSDGAGACGPTRRDVVVRAAGEIVERWAVAAQERAGAPLLFPDAGPSGAAAGPTADFCRARGLRELLERDAAMRGWYAPGSVRLLDPAESLLRLGSMTRVLERLADADVELVPVLLPSRCTSTVVTMYALLDVPREIVACGLGCDADLEAALRTASREACQVHDFYTGMRRSVGRPSAPGAVRSETDRARWWGADGNVEAFRRWLAAVADADGAEDLPAVPWRDLEAGTRFTDLTGSLPDAVAAAGWHAGRVEHPGLVPLITDETGDTGRRLSRGGAHGLPHPVI